MRTFQYNELDKEGNPVTITITDIDILRDYFPWWSEEMRRIGRPDQINEDDCIEDFIFAHWAWEIK